MTLDEALREAASRLAACDTSRLDAEVLLAHVCGVDRTWLYTWGDREITPPQRAGFDALVERRQAGEPVAYLTGRREFWGLSLETSPATLIPRPDTEALVEAALSCAEGALSQGVQGRLLDLGTGTGAVALAFASECPAWNVTGVDIEPRAVAVAARNRDRLALPNAVFRHSDWFTALDGEIFDVIVSNPPYLSDDDPHLASGDVRFEPRSALVAGEKGLADLSRLANDAVAYLRTGGWLWLEHGCDQAAAVRDLLNQAGFDDVASRRDLAGLERVTGGRWQGRRR